MTLAAARGVSFCFQKLPAGHRMKAFSRSDYQWSSLRDSLRMRIAAGVLLAVVLALWLAAYLTSHFLRQDMERSIAAQQFSTVSLVAQGIDRSLRERRQALEGVAELISPALMADPQRLQMTLQDRVVVPLMFNWGAVVVDRRGVAIASVPSQYGRLGTDYSDLPAVRQALNAGRPMFFDPLIGKRTGQPVLTIVAPIKDAEGRQLGLVMGITNLAQANFLDELNNSTYGKTGDFQLVAPRTRQIISSSNKARIMQSGPHAGDDPVFERYLAGYEGSAVNRSRRGRVELSSSKRIAATGWLLQVALPAEEAFAPIHDMQQRLVGISLLLSLLVGSLGWWWLRRQFDPLEEAASLLRRMRHEVALRRPLPVRRSDEIGELARAFNALQETLVAEEAKAAEYAANQRLGKIVAQVPGVVFQSRQLADGSLLLSYVSAGCREVYGMGPEELLASPAGLLTLVPADDALRLLAGQQASARSLLPWRQEFRTFLGDGQSKWLMLNAVPERAVGGETEWFGFIADISEAKAIDAQLRIAASTFESQEGIVITDADSRIVRVNKAFTEVTGYSAKEVLGRTPGLLKSGRHDGDFYRQLWAVLLRDGYWRGELWNRRKNGEIYAEWVTITAVKDERGRITHYVGAFTDITEHKQIEDEVRRLAFYDPLTNLPNRRLFYDRLDQALATAARTRTCGALLFLDLDQFKVLNDKHGHFMGDELLLEVARRLTLCVRASDTVARLGGDEFVVLLQDLAGQDDDDGVVRHEAGLVAEKIRQALAEPYLLSPGRDQLDQSPVVHNCSTSIGVALFPGNTNKRDELLRQSDVAMYAAKAAGRNVVRFFEDALLSED